ncbi:MAG TPA: FAD-dependent monooxygenase, partial [Polyangiaceae bacterium]
MPVSFVLKIVHFDQPQTLRALGGKLPVLRAEDAPRWERQIHRAADWRQDTDVECDVVVVGTGAGGAVVGTELAKRGLAVVFIEEGGHYRSQDFRGSVVHAH